MANSLLDFVMSLVRDSDAAARYAADPEQTISDAGLTDVTTVDVSNLIPVVNESLSVSAPAPGAGPSFDTVDTEAVSNVWASGAATAAFDSFADQVPEAIGDTQPVIGDLIDQPEPMVPPTANPFAESVVGVDSAIPDVDPASLQIDDPVIDEAPLDEPAPFVDSDSPAPDSARFDDGPGGFDALG